MKGWQKVTLLRSCWWAIVGPGQGNIDVQKSKRGGGAWKLVSLAQYLAKYVTKEISQVERDLGAHRFRASLGIEIPTVKRFLSWVDVRKVSELFLEHFGVAMRSMWLSDDMLVGWAASW